MKFSSSAFRYMILVATVSAGCHHDIQNNKEIIVRENGNKSYYGMVGKDSVYEYTLKNEHGLKAVISNYGGTILELWTPDRTGKMGNIVLGYDSLAGYLQKSNPYFGALIGRYANRIHLASFSIVGKKYTLESNNNGNALHGGLKGFDKVIWTVDQVNDSSLALSHKSRDGDEGYPGNLNVKVVYTLTDYDGLRIDYTAITDMKTPVNLTNHAYFNLSAGKDSTILDHEITIYTHRYTPVNDSLIPTGKIATVENTPFDFQKRKKIGRDIQKVRGGYDHNFVLKEKSDSSWWLAARLYDPESGRVMDVSTTQPGIQFYSGNFLDGTLIGRDGKKIPKHGGLCLETQHFPDSPNQPAFPNTILEPGQVFHESTEYVFSTKP
jgi:aldose 1-epimerase